MLKKKCTVLVLLLLISGNICSMNKIIEDDDSITKFKNIPREIHCLILEFVCEPSKQPHLYAINICKGYLNYSLINKECKKGVDYKPSTNAFGGKLYKMLKGKKLKAVEAEGVHILRKAATLSTSLKLIPQEDVPYIITAIALAKLLNSEKCTALLIDFFEGLVQSTNKEKINFTEKYIYGCLLIPYKYQSIKGWGCDYYLLNLGGELKRASFGDGYLKDTFSKQLDLTPYVWGGVSVSEFKATLELGLLYSDNPDDYFSASPILASLLNKTEENNKKVHNYMRDMYEKYKPYLFCVRKGMSRKSVKCNIL